MLLASFLFFHIQATFRFLSVPTANGLLYRVLGLYGLYQPHSSITIVSELSLPFVFSQLILQSLSKLIVKIWYKSAFIFKASVATYLYRTKSEFLNVSTKLVFSYSLNIAMHTSCSLPVLSVQFIHLCYLNLAFLLCQACFKVPPWHFLCFFKPPDLSSKCSCLNFSVFSLCSIVVLFLLYICVRVHVYMYTYVCTYTCIHTHIFSISLLRWNTVGNQPSVYTVDI